MEKFVDRVRGNGATPIWVIFPIRDIMKKEESKYDVIEKFAEAEAKRLGMPVLRLDPIFRGYLGKNPDSLLWNPSEVGGHLSPEGNRLTAQAIYGLLQANNLLKVSN